MKNYNGLTYLLKTGHQECKEESGKRENEIGIIQDGKTNKIKENDRRMIK